MSELNTLLDKKIKPPIKFILIMFMLGTINALQKELQLKFKLKIFVKVRVHSIFQFHLGPSNHNKTLSTEQK